MELRFVVTEMLLHEGHSGARPGTIIVERIEALNTKRVAEDGYGRGTTIVARTSTGDYFVVEEETLAPLDENMWCFRRADHDLCNVTDDHQTITITPDELHAFREQHGTRYRAYVYRRIQTRQFVKVSKKPRRKSPLRHLIQT